jgi:F0F1-type ATP synthase assembly protein I
MSETGGWTRAYKAVALVSALPISTIAGGLLGAFLDRATGGGWILTALLGLLGFSAGILQLFRGLQNPPDDDPRDHPP